MFFMIGVYPGSFDPLTNGHLNIIERTINIFHEIHIVVAVNRNKTSLFTPEERLSVIEEVLGVQSKKVKVVIWDKLIVEYMKLINARIIIRGVRSLADFSHEFDLSHLNKGIYPEIETLLLPADPRFFTVSSSAVKEIASFSGDISNFVPHAVERIIRNKYSLY